MSGRKRQQGPWTHYLSRWSPLIPTVVLAGILRTPLGHGLYLRVGWALAAAVVFLWGMLGIERHWPKHCWRCTRLTAEDPQGRAQWLDPLLRFDHLLIANAPVWGVTVTGVVICGSLILTNIGTALQLSPMWGWGTYAAGSLVYLVFVWSQVEHRQLRGWCRYCAGVGGSV